MNASKIINELEQLIQTERENTIKIIDCIIKIHKKRIYAMEGFSTVKKLLVQRFGYSEGQAYRRIQAAKLISIRPQVKKDLVKGKTNLTSLSNIQRFIDVEDVEDPDEVLKKTLGKTTRDVELQLLDLSKREYKRKRSIKRVTINDYELTLTISETLFHKLEKVKSLSVRKKVPNLEEVLEIMADHTLKKIDPAQQVSRMYKKSYRSRAVSPALRSNLYIRDEGKCQWTHPSTGYKCNDTFNLQVDHIVPWSKGGKTQLSNLQLLCATHNRFKSCN